MNQAVSVLRFVFFASGSVFAFAVLAPMVGVKIAEGLSYAMLGTSISICMLTMPALFTWMSSVKNGDDVQRSEGEQ